MVFLASNSVTWVKGQPAHRRRRGKLLRHGHEGDVVLLQGGHQTREVKEGTRQAIQFINEKAIDGVGLDISEQALQRRAFEGAAREAGVIVALLQADPALVCLAVNESLSGFPLGIERVEIGVQVFFRRLARVDGAANQCRCCGYRRNVH